MPYWRLAAFYFCFFAILGALVPYWGPYLRSRGFGAAEIGELIAILHATRIVAPNLWGWVTDRTGQRMSVIRLAAFAATLLFTGVLLGDGYWWLAAVMAAFSFFWNAALPQFEANTFNHLVGQTHRYSLIRLWGSVGFIGAVVVMGQAVDRFGVRLVPWVVLFLLAALWMSAVLAPGAGQPHREGAEQPFLRVLCRPRIAGFLAACFLLQVSHGPFYAFYSIYLEDHGYRGAVIGGLWALGVAAEVVVFLLMHRWLPRFGPRRLMLTAMGLAVIRWLMVGAFPALPTLQALAQVLHAATFGMYHAVGITLVDRFFIGRNQGRGQALYSSLTFGAGVAAGSLASGHLWERIGDAQTFYAAAAVAAGAALVALLSVPGRTRDPSV